MKYPMILASQFVSKFDNKAVISHLFIYIAYAKKVNIYLKLTLSRFSICMPLFTKTYVPSFSVPAFLLPSLF